MWWISHWDPHSTLYTPHSTLSTPHSTLYTFDSTLQIGNRGNMYKTVQINYCRKVLCVTAYPCVSTSVPFTYVWAFGFVGYYFVLQSLHKVVPSTTLYYKACTKHFPVLLCTTKLAQSTFQYYFVRLAQSTFQHYFVLQSLRKALPSTKLAQSTSQYYFVLKSLHKARSSTTLYYKACTKSFPVLLCTTKLAQSNSQYYFVLQSLRKTFPVRLCTTKLAQRRQRTSRNSRRDWRFAASPIDTELTGPRRRDDDATTTRRATGGEQGSSHQTPRL